MNFLTWLNTVILGILVVVGLLKLADSGDGSGACCVVVLVGMFVAACALAAAVWGAGELAGWW